jgi:tetratricopeptide (TPR) repeat protein
MSETEAQLLDQAIDAHRRGRIADAASGYRRILDERPDHADALHLLGVTEAQTGRLLESVALIRAATRVQPQNAVAFNNLGNAYKALGQPAAALESYERSLALQPRQGETHFNLGTVLLALGRPAQALASFEQAVAFAPLFADAWNLRGVALGESGRHTEALESYERALALRPDFAGAWNNQGMELQALGRPLDALASFERALRIQPDMLDALNNHGAALGCLNRLDEGLASFDRALAVAPHDPVAAWNKSTTLLLRGNFAEGWPLYEARMRVKGLPIRIESSGQPRWTGEQPIHGKTVYVHAEQGLGDTLQFCRYVPLLRARGAEVVFEVQPQLRALLQALPGGARLIAHRAEPVGPFDLYCSLQSLPAAFRTDLASIPAGVPYLSAAPDRIAYWASRVNDELGSAPRALRVGIAWQGNTSVESGRLRGRSIPLAAFAPLAAFPGLKLVALQKGPGAQQLATAPFSDRVFSFGDELDPGADAFVDTAALMMSLDLVITADTSIAHLAGALGVRVWVLLHTTSEWRWLTGRADSPWYPSMRLFRQTTPGDWAPVLAAVLEQLRAPAAPV